MCVYIYIITIYIYTVCIYIYTLTAIIFPSGNPTHKEVDDPDPSGRAPIFLQGLGQLQTPPRIGDAQGTITWGC